MTTLSLALLLMTACSGGNGASGGGPADASGDGAGGVASNTRPAVVFDSPIKVTGTEQTLNLAFSHPEGADKIMTVQLMISPTLNSKKSCWIEYAPKLGTVRMMDGSGTGIAGAAGTLSNSECSIDESGLKGTVNGNSLTLSVPVRLSSNVENTQSILAIASSATEHSGWKTLGVWVRDPKP